MRDARNRKKDDIMSESSLWGGLLSVLFARRAPLRIARRRRTTHAASVWRLSLYPWSMFCPQRLDTGTAQPEIPADL
jgi:hypothetical protein